MREISVKSPTGEEILGETAFPRVSPPLSSVDATALYVWVGDCDIIIQIVFFFFGKGDTALILTTIKISIQSRSSQLGRLHLSNLGYPWMARTNVSISLKRTI